MDLSKEPYYNTSFLSPSLQIQIRALQEVIKSTTVQLDEVKQLQTQYSKENRPSLVIDVSTVNTGVGVGIYPGITSKGEGGGGWEVGLDQDKYP